MDFATVAGSAVLAALVSAIVSLHVNARNIELKAITNERAKWREHIRRLAVEICEAATDTQTTADERARRLEKLLLALKLTSPP